MHVKPQNLAWSLKMTLISLFRQEQTKVCFKCGTELPLASFYKHPRMKDGRLNKCKACTKSDSTNHRNANLDRVREYDRERAKSPERRAALTAQAKRFRALNRAKYLAHNAVNNAVRDGRLIKPAECSQCGDMTKIHGHHDDYSKPLKVRWLCAVCHSAWHKQNGEGIY